MHVIIIKHGAYKQTTFERGAEESSISRQALARCAKCKEHGQNSRMYKKDNLATAQSTF
jgi:hypothetical protein